MAGGSIPHPATNFLTGYYPITAHKMEKPKHFTIGTTTSTEDDPGKEVIALFREGADGMDRVWEIDPDTLKKMVLVIRRSGKFPDLENALNAY